MPKLLITENCIVNYGDDRGGVDQAAGDGVDVSKDTARALVTAGRALYINKADDPDKGGRNTATKDMLKAAEAMARAKYEARQAVQTSAQQGEGN